MSDPLTSSADDSAMESLQLLDLADLDLRLADGANPVAQLRAALEHGDEMLRARFLEGSPAAELVPLRACLVDALLVRAWNHCLGASPGEVALVAVGGYGRGELHPGSDVDLMVLLTEEPAAPLAGRIESFVSTLWDLGLDVGHSVRTLEDCEREARADITVATNLLEARLLAGPQALFQRLQEVTGPDRLWSSRDFFEAKWAEQTTRHAKHHDTGYNLEPNIKESPGGLRDIHVIGWVAKRHFGTPDLHGLVQHGFLTQGEHETLMRGQHFLWDVRFALHVLAGRREDRLLFDHQSALATQFGYSDTEHTLAVEQFMQRYYRTVMQLNRLNEMLLQLYQEAILYANQDEAPTLLNKRFQVKRGFIEVTHPNVFRRYPFALLELFLLMQQHPEIRGVRASTIRLIRSHRDQINERFRDDLRCRSLFLEILRQPRGITRALRRMHTYGILGRYLPAFNQVAGRMQYDLFHVYTVDSHTLMVVRNLRRLAVPEFTHEFPECSRLMSTVAKPELLLLAGLFHDIGKGRGGDHSELGADESYRFCVHHGLSRYDSRMVAWLVRNHLLMSMTAQRKDISDPQVVNAFARQVGDSRHLDQLYLLTIADIRGTNPALWNSWRQALLRELYQLTKRALRRGLGNPIDAEELVRETQAGARRRLRAMGIHHMTARALWRHFTPDYFLRYSADEVAWHTAAIDRVRDGSELPLVLIDPRTQRGGTEVFVYTGDRDNVFALTVHTLSRLGLDIQDARIITTSNGYTLDSFLVLEENGQPVEPGFREEEIVAALREALQHTDHLPRAGLRAPPRRLRHFSTPLQLGFEVDAHNERTMLEVIAADRPGLLAQIGAAFARLGLRLQNAKIATIGERAEDVFFITDGENRPLDETAREALRELLAENLDHEGRELERLADGH